jgi:hypothetical protein
MKIHVPEKKVSSIILVIMLTVLTQVMSFCQNRQNPGQTSQGNTQTLTPAQVSAIKTILSKYNASKLTAADARAIHEKFREAGLHAGPETRDAIVAAGFDPEKLRTLDPPKNPGNQANPAPPSTEERLKTLQEKVIKPLALNTAQNNAIIKAYKEFYTGMQNLKKAEVNPQPPPDKSKVEPLEKARDEKIRQVLSGEQFMKYKELEKASRPPRPENQVPKKN